MRSNSDRRKDQAAPDNDEHIGEEVAQLQERLAEATQKAEEYVALAQRVQADFVNYKRRIEQDREEQNRQANARLMLKLLPTLDDFERAMDSVRADLAGLHWVQGIGHIQRKLLSELESEGLQRIEAQGKEFDPRLHEAVLYEEVDTEDDGKVLSVLQTGYKLHDRVIRPAMVKVGKGSPARPAPEDEQRFGATFLEED